MSEERKMKSMLKKSMLVASCAAAVSGVSVPVQAADWLMIQGGERDDQAARARVWGFIQAQYQKNNSTANGGGGYIPPKLIGPDLDTQSAFNVNRARIGVRGTGMPLDSNVNYFFLVEFGNNAITNPGNSFAYITDASITLNHLKEFTRVRVGQFKVPMAEEIYQGIALFDYINFSDGINQMLLERVPNRRSKSGNVSPQTLPVGTSLNTFNNPVAAARDVGIQFFNSIRVAPSWELGYSVMIANGNGINSSDNDNNKDTHLYFNLTKIYKGSGPRRQDWKTFAWYTKGKRTIDATFVDANGDGIDDTYDPKEYDRKRFGVGTKYFKLPFRLSAEWFRGKGVIFQGPDKPNFGLGPAGSATNPASTFSGLNPNARGTSWYVEGAYYIPKTRWELDMKYSSFNRMDNSTPVTLGPNVNVTPEIKFTDLTLGVQYHFNKKTRVAINLEKRDAEAVTWRAGVGPNANLDGVGNRYSIQLTHIF